MNLGNLLKFNREKELSREAFEAYYNRLPKDIEVSWFRDGNFIVGKVSAGENEFMTQGKNADDFINMVNDTVISVHRIPKEYFSSVKKAHTYMPPYAEKQKLEDTSIKGAIISLVKNQGVLEIIK